jgi:hypothetical protein
MRFPSFLYVCVEWTAERSEIRKYQRRCRRASLENLMLVCVYVTLCDTAVADLLLSYNFIAIVTGHGLGDSGRLGYVRFVAPLHGCYNDVVQLAILAPFDTRKFSLQSRRT